MDLQYFLNVYDAAQPDQARYRGHLPHGAKWTDGDRGVVWQGETPAMHFGICNIRYRGIRACEQGGRWPTAHQAGIALGFVGV